MFIILKLPEHLVYSEYFARTATCDIKKKIPNYCLGFFYPPKLYGFAEAVA
jgi:hypothetical protein